MSKSPMHAATDHARSQMAAREAAAEQTLRTAHSHMLAALQPALDSLYRDIEAQQQAGEKVSLAWLHEGNRLAHLKQTVTNQVNHFAQLTQITVGQSQHTGQATGAKMAQTQLAASVPDGVQWTFKAAHPLTGKKL